MVEQDRVTLRSPLITVRTLHKDYLHEQKVIPVLKGLDLVVQPGEMISITGASGVGKTTFLHVLGTLDEPTRGQIQFDGLDPFALSDRQRAQFRRRNVGFVFQFHHLLPQFTALENVMMPARIDRIPADEAQSRAVGLLEKLGLGHRLKHRPSELSGGEQQRVAVARAVVMRPKVVLADEPTGNLDVQTGEGIYDLLFQINQESGVAMIIVTHNPQLAALMPTRLHLHDGILSPASEMTNPEAAQ
ncbi:MAG: ABC transporter ATP-binding protein [Bradymonadales bacterium]|nr:ABC transporter ATP-binding protein [Bradymonadales bacterium]